MDRRLGDRRPVTWLHLTWEVDRRARWKTRRVEERLIGLDVSVSGMRAAARTVPGLVVGSTVAVNLNDHVARARIQRVEPDEDPEVSVYGMQFIEPPADFVEALFVQAGEEPSDKAEEFWRRAT